MIIGGAQKNALTLSQAFNKPPYKTLLVTGPETGPEGSLHEELRECGVDYKILPSLVRKISPYHDIFALWHLYRLIKVFRPDIVHTESSKAGVLGRLAARMARVQGIVHTVHGWGFHDEMSRTKRGIFISVEKVSARMTDRLIAVSDYNIQKGLEAGIGPAGKYITIHSGIDIHYFSQFSGQGEQVRREFGIDADSVLLGTVGRISHQKSPLEFVEAVKRIRKCFPDIKAIMVGDGPLRHRVEEKIKKCDLSDTIFLTGIRSDIPKFMDAFDIFLLTSHWEGLPRVFAEAMVMETPIVTTNVDGAPQAVKEGENGFLVPVGNIDKLVERVCLLIKNKPLCRRMGQAGVRRAEQFGTEEMIKRTERLYTEILSSPPQFSGHAVNTK